jgi:thiol-disulfide isomerase/thioredoxin
MIPRIPVTIIISVLVSLASFAGAQDKNPNEILDASRDALQEISGLSAQFRMKGDGGSMFADTLPSMNGQFFFGNHDELGKVIHCIGEIREQQTSPTQAIDMLIASDRYLWTEISKRTINERPIASSTRGLPTGFQLVLIDSIISDDPFAKDANNAQSIDLLAQETISGVLCDVIHIKRAKPDARSNRTGKGAYTDVRWYIGDKDKLPRKVDHITDAGLVKITLSFELNNIKIIDPTQLQLDIARPDGFTFKSTMPKERTEEQVEDPAIPTITEPSLQPTDRTANPNPKPAEPRIKRAPSYAFTPASGSETNNATQDGRVTVLYFWGSWCVPCKATSPLVSQLTQDFALEPVDVFGLAIREADPAQTTLDFNSSNFLHALVLDADQLISSFKVRVFPTIVVIDHTGVITYQRSINKETTAEDLVESAREAVQQAIDAQ